MTRWLVLAAALVACGKKTDDKRADPHETPSHGEPAAPAGGAPASGLAIKDDPVADFTGSYDRAFAQIDPQTRHTTLAFVRGCPALTCATGAWEPEQVAHVCPKAYIATFDVPADEVTSSDGAKYKLDLHIAGPADGASTGTLERVKLELSVLNHDGVAGTAHQHTTESSVEGSFHAEVCPRT